MFFLKTTCSPTDPPSDLQHVKNSPGPTLHRYVQKMGSEPTYLSRDENVQSTATTCSYWHLPVGLKYKSESGCTYGEKCRFRHAEVDGHPNKKSKKSGGKGSVALLKESIQLGCVTRFPSEQIYSTERGKIGIKSHRQILQGHVAPLQHSGKKGSIAWSYSKSANIRALPDLRKEQEETLRQDRCARRGAWTWRKEG